MKKNTQYPLENFITFGSLNFYDHDDQMILYNKTFKCPQVYRVLLKFNFLQLKILPLLPNFTKFYFFVEILD